MKPRELHLKDVFDSDRETIITELYDRVITIPIESRTALKKRTLYSHWKRTHKGSLYPLWLALRSR